MRVERSQGENVFEDIGSYSIPGTTRGGLESELQSRGFR
jgi:hypothetical protein